MERTMESVRLVWNGMGGELDSKIVTFDIDDENAIALALAAMIKGNVVTPGDSFVIEAQAA